MRRERKYGNLLVNKKIKGKPEFCFWWNLTPDAFSG
jgi:hypothetical protein